MAVRSWFTVPVLAILVPALTSCARPGGQTPIKEVPPDEATESPASDSADLTYERARPVFLEFYTPPQIEVDAAIPQYALPLKPDQIVNWAEASAHFKNEGTAALILKNGFAVEAGWGKQLGLIEEAYEHLPKGAPMFVTVDTALHIQHVLFDQLYSEIEQTYMLDDLQAITDAGLGSFRQAYSAHVKSAGASTKQAAAARRTLAYFAVAACLLDPNVELPKAVEREARDELRNIEAGVIAYSEIFRYWIDYGRFAPRGHYARTEALRRYFRAMTWYAECVFLFQEGIVDGGTADIQTMQALQIGRFLVENKDAHDRWRRMHAVLEFFAGAVDDVSLADVIRIKSVLDEALAAAARGGSTTGESTYLKLLRERLHAIAPPAIRAATGMPVRDEPATPERRRQWLEQARGMRLFGRRFSLDGYAMSELTGFTFMGDGRPMTRADTPMGPVRGYPSPLDVMALLGSTRAEAIVRAAGDADYAHYDRELARLKTEVGQLTDDDWHGSLAMCRLNVIRMLVAPVPEGYPTAMRSAAWRDERISSGLATWAYVQRRAGLAHKVPFTHPPGAWGDGAESGLAHYVEPAPRVYAEMAAMTDSTLKGLADVLPKAANGDEAESGYARLRTADNLERLADWLRRLAAISAKELRNEPLDDDDMSFMLWVPEEVRLMTSGTVKALREPAFVADVFAEPNEGSVLEVATGRFDLLWIVCQLPDGTKVLAAGPVMSYYEFKQPMDARLSDEDWRDKLDEGTASDPPAWTKSFLTRTPKTPPKQ